MPRVHIYIIQTKLSIKTAERRVKLAFELSIEKNSQTTDECKMELDIVSTRKKLVSKTEPGGVNWTMVKQDSPQSEKNEIWYRS